MTERERKLPQVVSIRLDEPTREAISSYASANGMTTSQAIRVLLALSLKSEGGVDAAFREAAFREGVILGLARIREQFTTQIQDVVKQSLSGLEEL